MSRSLLQRVRYALLGIAILVFFVSLAAAVYDQRRRTEIYEDAFRNTSWSVAQLEREFLLFQYMLTKYTAGLGSVNHEDITVQFEILWSRIPVILKGGEGSVIRELPGTIKTLNDIKGALERTETVVYTLEPGDDEAYESITSELSPLQTPLHRVTQKTLIYTNSLGQELTGSNSVFRMSVFLFGILASGFVLVVMLLRDSARAAYLAHHDPLTGLPNRALFEDRLKLAMASSSRRGEAMALHYIDIDNFKDINDTRGHKAGDQLLVKLGEQLQSTIRDADTVARLSGDEFAVIQLDLAHLRDATALAERLITAVSQPTQLNEGTISVACSIGLATYLNEELTTEELAKQADTALYRAKAEGGGIYRVYIESMEHRFARA